MNCLDIAIYLCIIFWLALYIHITHDINGEMTLRSGVIQKILQKMHVTLDTSVFIPTIRSTKINQSDMSLSIPTSSISSDGVDKVDSVNVFIQRPLSTSNGQTSMNLILYIHGGGFVCGSAPWYGRYARLLANATGYTIATIDYALSPENKFPIALHQVLDVYRYYQSLGIYDKIGFFGDSAGGNIIASACFILRSDIRTPPPSFQILLYPYLDMTRFNRDSHNRYKQSYLITRRSLRLAREYYLDKETDPCDPRVSPIMMSDMSNTCPTLIISAQHDVILDEAIEFNTKLQLAHVQVQHKIYQGSLHGFFIDELPSLRDTVIKDVKLFLNLLIM